jgi:phospholipid/cholesterol/gamma-HCH transport system permease protein
MKEQLLEIKSIFKLFFSTLARLGQVRGSETVLALTQIGVESVPIIAISTAFAGMVVTNEMAYHMDLALHTVSMMPGFSGQFILRELGIAIPALLLVAKVGASITAEVSSMQVTEQIDALRLLGIDPVGYLVVPRFIASIIASICLTMIASFVTVGCAILIAVSKYGFSILEYINALRHFVGGKDLACALVKGAVYGAVIPIVSCSFGFNCKGGAEGVGNATTNSVVTSTTLIILFDFILTYAFTWIF